MEIMPFNSHHTHRFFHVLVIGYQPITTQMRSSNQFECRAFRKLIRRNNTFLQRSTEGLPIAKEQYPQKYTGGSRSRRK